MTKREMFVAMTTGAVVTEEMAAKAMECLAAMDRANEKAKSRERKLSPKEQEARAAREQIARLVASQLSMEPKTAADVAAMGIEGIATSPKASAALRLAVELGLAQAQDVKSGKSKVKGYTLVHTEL